MATNWPPPTAPAWPPAGYTNLGFSTIDEGRLFCAAAGYPIVAPTAAETTAFFANARCDQAHRVDGIIVVINGVRYPFAQCRGAEKLNLMLWPPYELPS